LICFIITIAAAAVALVAGASAQANGTVVYVTDVVSQYTTYCPAATQVTHNGVTYTITEVSFRNDLLRVIHHTNPIPSGHHLDHHQLPMHCHPCSYL